MTPHPDTSNVTSSVLTRSAFQCILDPDTSDPTDHLTEQAVEFCQRVGSTATTVSKIVGTRDEAVYRAIEEGIQRVNRKAAARPYQVQKWAILERDFSISGGELGRWASAPVLPGTVWEGGGRGRACEVPAGRSQRVLGVMNTHIPPMGDTHSLVHGLGCDGHIMGHVLELVNLNIQHLTWL